MRRVFEGPVPATFYKLVRHGRYPRYTLTMYSCLFRTARTHVETKAPAPRTCYVLICCDMVRVCARGCTSRLRQGLSHGCRGCFLDGACCTIMYDKRVDYTITQLYSIVYVSAKYALFLACRSPAAKFFLALSAAGQARAPSVLYDACLDPGRAPWWCS